MTTPTIADYLKYANLQMAAEAFLYDEQTKTVKTGQQLIDALKVGNKHASFFTQTQADNFAAHWKVVDQKADTPTGFSGSLFQCIQDDPATGAKAGELVISFRSTEFIDDAIRDSAATNTLEVHDTGFAWGQITDMEKWYADLKLSGAIPSGSQLSVTGYSLGGHLATAFNLLRRDELNQGPPSVTLTQVVTYNGAGVGLVNQGTLTSALDVFRDLRNNPDQIKSKLNFTLPGLSTFYDTLRQNLANKTWTATQGRDALNGLTSQFLGNLVKFDAEKKPLEKALNDIIALQTEAARIKPYVAGGTGPDAGKSPLEVLSSDILAESFDYRLAVDLAGRLTKGASYYGDFVGITEMKPGTPPLLNQYDVVGVETTTTPWSAVSYSQYHYGEPISAFIEDQPFTRGWFTAQFAKSLASIDGIKLLQNSYDTNNFSDSHSLVLIIDSLNVQNLLKTMDPDATQGQIEAVFKAASAARAAPNIGTQGKAEGDVLETVLDGLLRLFTHEDPKLRNGKTTTGDDLLTGNTWADKDLRKTFYDKLNTLTDLLKSGSLKDLVGKVTLSLPDTSLATTARPDFAAFLTLHTLAPFALKAAPGKESEVEAALSSAWTSVNGIDVYDAWAKDRDLTPEQRKTADLTYTDRYLADRALQLSVASIGNQNNNGFASTGGAISTRFRDTDIDSATYAFAAGGLDIARTANGDAGRLAYAFQSQVAQQRERFITFGSDGATADTLTGGVNDDRLYGLGGDDTLNGEKGNDYLEV